MLYNCVSNLNCRYYYDHYNHIEIAKAATEESTSSLALLKPSINVEANTSSCASAKESLPECTLFGTANGQTNRQNPLHQRMFMMD